MTRRCALTDAQWDLIEGLLPGRVGHVGRPASNNRLFVEAVLDRYRACIPWRDLPERFGDFRVIHLRHSRWSRSGVWRRVFEALAQETDNEWAMIDSTIVRAHQHSAGAKKPRLRGHRTQPRRSERQNPCHHRRTGQPHRVSFDARTSARS